MDSSPCPKCLRLQRARAENQTGHCRVCHRWQSLYQATFISFFEAVHEHLGCVECGQGAWCRDFDLTDDAACAKRAHKHPIGTCVPRPETGR